VEAVQKARTSVVTVIIPKTQYQTRDTTGTGVIIDERGYIVTNRHVVAGRQTVGVRLYDGRQFNGEVILSSPSHDLAIVRISTGFALKAMRLAPVSDLMVGETVIAIGHPYGYTNTVSVGIISALGRTITMPTGEVLSGLIQTDAAINPGNSGGPLLNINGELIGINNAIRDGAQGIAFAINAGTVRDLVATRLSALRISRVGHGLECKEKVVGETGDRQFVVVGAVYQATPAAQAGLRPGDEILTVGDREVANSFDVERSLWDRQPGQQVTMKVRRQGKDMLVKLTLADGRTMNQTAKIDFSSQPATGQVATTAASSPTNVIHVGHQADSKNQQNVTNASRSPSSERGVPVKATATTQTQAQAEGMPDGGNFTTTATSSTTQQHPVFAFLTIHYATTRR
jgi:serine protease Do